MIDIKDLRIGNWVLCVDSTHEKKIHAQIDAIEEGQTCILVREDNCNWFLDIGFIEAIPLTAEILEKNFEYNVYNDYGYYELNDKFCLRGYDTQFFLCFWDDIEDSCYQCPKYIYSVKSVHNLQNILRDCGIDKEITL